MKNELVAKSGGRVIGEVEVPGDKSISHRAIIFGSLASGKSIIENCLMGDDVLATIRAFKDMGIEINVSSENLVSINGCNMSIRQGKYQLDLGNSGTSIRLLMGLLTGMGINALLTGDDSLRRRPMKRVSDPLAKMGAKIKLTNHEYAPLELFGSELLKPIKFEPKVASAQVKSAVLLAGLFCDGETVVKEITQTRDHTERMLALFGGDIKVQGGHIFVTGKPTLKAQKLTVPGDFSSAAFLLVGAIIADQGELLIKNVGLNPTRLGLIEMLKKMGANIHVNLISSEFEPVGDIRVRNGDLNGITVDPSLIPAAIDEFPIFFIAAACAEGVTVLRGANELRHKESDRLAVMGEGLSRMGIKVKRFDDGIEIQGGAISGGSVNARGDHRCAMSFIIASLKAKRSIKILNTKEITTSFPNFLEIINSLGLSVN